MMDTAESIASSTSSSSSPDIIPSTSRKRIIFLDVYAGRNQFLFRPHNMMKHTSTGTTTTTTTATTKNRDGNDKSFVCRKTRNQQSQSSSLDHHVPSKLPPTSSSPSVSNNNVFTKTDIGQDGCTILCQAQNCYRIGIHRCCSCERAAYCSENCRIHDREQHEEFCHNHAITNSKRNELIHKNYYNYYQHHQHHHHQQSQVEEEQEQDDEDEEEEEEEEKKKIEGNICDSNNGTKIRKRAGHDGACCCHKDDNLCSDSTSQQRHQQQQKEEALVVSFCPHCYMPVCQEWECCKYHLDHCDAYHQCCKSRINLIDSNDAEQEEQWVLVEKPNDGTEAWVIIERVSLKTLKELSTSSYKKSRKIVMESDRERW